MRGMCFIHCGLKNFENEQKNEDEEVGGNERAIGPETIKFLLALFASEIYNTRIGELCMAEEKDSKKIHEEYLADLEKQLYDCVKGLAEEYGSPQAVTIVAGIVRDFKRVYKFMIVGVKKALWEWMKVYDAELGK